MTTSCNIRFNKKLFRQQVVNGWRNWLIGIVATGSLTYLGYWLAVSKGWHMAIVVVPGIIFLYIFVGGLLVGIPDTLDYNRMHINKKKSNRVAPTDR